MEQSRLDRVVDIAADLAGKADEIEDVVVLYTKKGQGSGSMDNGVSVERAVFMVESFKYWMLVAMHSKD